MENIKLIYILRKSDDIKVLGRYYCSLRLILGLFSPPGLCYDTDLPPFNNQQGYLVDSLAGLLFIDMKHLSKKHPSFSKVLIFGVFIVNLIVIAFTLVIVWRTLDASPLIYLIPSVAAEVSAATGFYYWKAKAENKAKYAQKYVTDMADKYGIENVERICEIIFNH